MLPLNGDADAARDDVLRAASIVLDTLLVRRGEEAARHFIERKHDNAIALCVPIEAASDPDLHFGLADYTISLLQPGAQLVVAAARQGEKGARIHFSRRESSGGTVWVPMTTTLKGEEVIVGQFSGNAEVKQHGLSQLLQAASHIGTVAAEAAAALGGAHPRLGTQLHLSSSSTLQ